jgi:hypothetical protein
MNGGGRIVTRIETLTKYRVDGEEFDDLRKANAAKRRIEKEEKKRREQDRADNENADKHWSTERARVAKLLEPFLCEGAVVEGPNPPDGAIVLWDGIRRVSLVPNGDDAAYLTIAGE